MEIHYLSPLEQVAMLAHTALFTGHILLHGKYYALYHAHIATTVDLTMDITNLLSNPLNLYLNMHLRQTVSLTSGCHPQVGKGQPGNWVLITEFLCQQSGGLDMIPPLAEYAQNALKHSRRNPTPFQSILGLIPAASDPMEGRPH